MTGLARFAHQGPVVALCLGRDAQRRRAPRW